MLSVIMFPKATWSSHEGKALCYFISSFPILFCFFFPLNFCTLLEFDTGHLRIPAIHEDMWRYLNLYEQSAGGILTCAAFGGTQSLLP